MTPLIERDASDRTQAVYTKNPFSIGGIGGLISSIQPALPAAEHIPDVALDRGMVLNVIFNTHYYHDSNLGNVNQITNSSGAVVQTYDYDSFGNIVNQTGSLTQAYQYKTKEYSPETGLIFFGARYYNPLIGRFITKDPMGMVDGPNLYIYCWNDPINKIDPWGLACIDQNITEWAEMMNAALTNPEVLTDVELAKAKGSLAAFGLSNKSIVEEKINELMNALKNIPQKPNPNKLVMPPPNPSMVKALGGLNWDTFKAMVKAKGNPVRFGVEETKALGEFLKQPYTE